MMGHRISQGSPNRGAFLEEVIPKFRSEGTVRISQGMGEGRGGMFQGGLGTEHIRTVPGAKESTSYSRMERSSV